MTSSGQLLWQETQAVMIQLKQISGADELVRCSGTGDLSRMSCSEGCVPYISIITHRLIYIDVHRYRNIQKYIRL